MKANRADVISPECFRTSAFFTPCVTCGSRVLPVHFSLRGGGPHCAAHCDCRHVAVVEVERVIAAADRLPSM